MLTSCLLLPVMTVMMEQTVDHLLILLRFMLYIIHLSLYNSTLSYPAYSTVCQVCVFLVRSFWHRNYTTKPGTTLANTLKYVAIESESCSRADLTYKAMVSTRRRCCAVRRPHSPGLFPKSRHIFLPQKQILCYKNSIVSHLAPYRFVFLTV